jgi:hypothetical protein
LDVDVVEDEFNVGLVAEVGSHGTPCVGCASLTTRTILFRGST